MAITTKVITVLHPAAEDIAETHRLAHRLSSLQGMTVGLIDNHKRNADVYLEELGRPAARRVRCAPSGHIPQNQPKSADAR